MMLSDKNSGEKGKGVAALPTVMLVGGILTEIVVAGILITYFLSQSSIGTKLSSEALSTAYAGVGDGIIKVVRNKNIDYSLSGSPYTISVGSRSAQVTICKDSKTTTLTCDTPALGKDEITSLGTAFTKKRQLRAILNVQSVTGEVRLESLSEVAL